MKKLFALILAFALCLSLTALAIPASADGEIVINEYKPHAHMTVGEMALAVVLPFGLLFFYALVGALEG